MAQDFIPLGAVADRVPRCWRSAAGGVTGTGASRSSGWQRDRDGNLSSVDMPQFGEVPAGKWSAWRCAVLACWDHTEPRLFSASSAASSSATSHACTVSLTSMALIA